MTKGITQETATGRDRHCVRRRPFWVRERAAIQYTSNSPFGRRGIGPCAGGGATRKNGMGFKQRERKRKKAAATAASQRAARESGSSARKSWLTIVASDTCCARCGGVLRVGREMIYRHSPREALCLPCAEADSGLSYRPSARWERARGKSRRRAAAGGAPRTARPGGKVVHTPAASHGGGPTMLLELLGSEDAVVRRSSRRS